MIDTSINKVFLGSKPRVLYTHPARQMHRRKVFTTGAFMPPNFRPDKPKKENAKEQPEEPQGPYSLVKLGKLANVMLLNAASITERGSATCLSCKGSGQCMCSACKGSGIVKTEKVRMNQIRHATHKLSMSLNPFQSKTTTMYDDDWKLSNRCRRCNGRGVCTCLACGGSGKRVP